jgi:hypothetical protein
MRDDHQRGRVSFPAKPAPPLLACLPDNSTSYQVVRLIAAAAAAASACSRQGRTWLPRRVCHQALAHPQDLDPAASAPV